MLWHVILISFKPETTEEQRKKIFDMYQTLDQDCGGSEAGILFWRVDHNMDLRKGVHLVEIAIFRDWDARETFRAHPKHNELTSILREVADWQIGNIEMRSEDVIRIIVEGGR